MVATDYKFWDIRIHHRRTTFTISSVSRDEFRYETLLNVSKFELYKDYDACKSYAFYLSYLNPSSGNTSLITNDKELKTMFELFANSTCINVYFSVIEQITDDSDLIDINLMDIDPLDKFMDGGVSNEVDNEEQMMKELGNDGGNGGEGMVNEGANDEGANDEGVNGGDGMVNEGANDEGVNGVVNEVANDERVNGGDGVVNEGATDEVVTGGDGVVNEGANDEGVTGGDGMVNVGANNGVNGVEGVADEEGNRGDRVENEEGNRGDRVENVADVGVNLGDVGVNLGEVGGNVGDVGEGVANEEERVANEEDRVANEGIDEEEDFQFSDDSDSDYIPNVEEEVDDNTGDVSEYSSQGDTDAMLSDYASNSDEEFIDSSGDEDDVIPDKSVQYENSMTGTIYKDRSDGRVELKVGHVFLSMYHFRDRLYDYAVQEGIELTKLRNEMKRITMRCAVPNCPFRIHASPYPTMNSISYMIKTMRVEHTCVRCTASNKTANSRWICQKIIEPLQANPLMPMEALRTFLSQKYGTKPSYMQLYRARTKALELGQGSHRESYKKVWQFAQEFLKTNPGSSCKVEAGPPTPPQSNNTFKRIFVCYNTVVQCFKAGCRPFLGLDGCFLKGPFGGQLVSAIALDGNKGIIPIAYAVVESECTDSWKFFLEHLKEMIGDNIDGIPWTFMSDSQKGLVEAIVTCFPFSQHRLCCRHLYSNFRKKFPGLLLKKLFWKAARAYDKYDFDHAMEGMKNLKEDAWQWLKDHRPESWSRHAFDSRVKTDHVTNNMTESFNSCVVDLRAKPLMQLLLGLETKLMNKLVRRFEKGQKWGNELITPNAKKLLNRNVGEGRSCDPTRAGGDEFVVLDKGTRFIVKIGEMRCTCNEWQISGIPCRHACSAIGRVNERADKYVHKFFQKDLYLKAYDGVIHPMVDERYWSSTDFLQLDPPPLKRQPGRPTKNRKRDATEEGPNKRFKRSVGVLCGNCKQPGHNRRHCQRAPVAKKSRDNDGNSLSGRGISTSGGTRGGTRGGSSQGQLGRGGSTQPRTGGSSQPRSTQGTTGGTSQPRRGGSSQPRRGGSSQPIRGGSSQLGSTQGTTCGRSGSARGRGRPRKTTTTENTNCTQDSNVLTQ